MEGVGLQRRLALLLVVRSFAFVVVVHGCMGLSVDCWRASFSVGLDAESVFYGLNAESRSLNVKRGRDYTTRLRNLLQILHSHSAAHAILFPMESVSLPA